MLRFVSAFFLGKRGFESYLVHTQEKQEEEPQLPPLEEFGYDITKAAREGKLDPLVGREDEIQRVIQILGRRRKNNPMLVGDPGVGKSAIVEGIAIKIVTGDIPPVLADKRLISLDLGSIVAGTKYRGDFEKRLKSIIHEVASNPDVILFIPSSVCVPSIYFTSSN